METIKSMNNRSDYRDLKGTELSSLRGLNTKTYTLGGGRKQTIVHAYPVNYKGADGAYRTIDCDLEYRKAEDGTGRYVTKDSPVTISFPAKTKQNESHITVSQSGKNTENTENTEKTALDISYDLSDGIALQVTSVKELKRV